jgi:haloacetate dehalogenase
VSTPALHPETAAVNGIRLHFRRGGDGPPVVLLHGWPQTGHCWRHVAGPLAADHTVIVPDLRGYGASDKPTGGFDKRTMAADVAALVHHLGFDTVAVVGHDRGGRVAHRMCLDHAERVSRAAVLDIVPTRTIFRATNQAIATGYYHWFYLIQPEPLPERMIGADPLFYLRQKLGHWSGDKNTAWTAPEALAEYERCFADPAVIHASCEDYRAAASVDLAHDEADLERRIGCPLLALWGEKGLMHKNFDVLATWRERAAGPVEGRALPCGHYLPEEQPEATLRELERFFAG